MNVVLISLTSAHTSQSSWFLISERSRIRCRCVCPHPLVRLGSTWSKPGAVIRSWLTNIPCLVLMQRYLSGWGWQGGPEEQSHFWGANQNPAGAGSSSSSRRRLGWCCSIPLLALWWHLGRLVALSPVSAWLLWSHLWPEHVQQWSVSKGRANWSLPST